MSDNSKLDLVTSNKKRVLILPSYWPSRAAPVVGSQVQEQSNLVSDDFDVKVVVCLPGMGLFRFLIHCVLDKILGISLFKSCENDLLNEDLEVRGFYYCEHKFLPYSWKRRNQIDAMEKTIKLYAKGGWNPDLIHARTAEYAGYCGAIFSGKLDIPLLLTENVIFVLADQPHLQRVREYVFTIEAASKVAVVSNWLKTQLLINGIKCDPKVVGNWINEDRFSIGHRKIGKGFRILSVGHTGFTKDWPTFFRAIKFLITELNCTDFKIDIAVTHVFDITSREFIPNLVQEFRLTEFVKVHYQVSRLEMVGMYQNCDVLVSTSINETFGIATAEAMFCGVPVVATDNGGVNDFINDKNGIKVTIGDFEKIANSILAIKNRELIFQPENVRESVLLKFGTDPFKKRISELYYKTIADYKT